MGISKDILAVERPKNTVVHDSHGNGKYRYSVVARTGCVRRTTGNYPVNGGIVGHIIDGSFVPCAPKVSRRQLTLRRFGDVAVTDHFGKDVLAELMACYDYKDALKIYCMALLRICEPNVTCSRLSSAYEDSWLSVQYPQVALSPGTVSSFVEKLGRDCAGMVSFMRKRLEKVAEDHRIIIDGTLKTDDSFVNSLSQFSRKARIKGTRDINIVYAYDADLGEPLCMKVYSGDVLDVTAYRQFLADMDISSGILIADKGFPVSEIRDLLKTGLHYISPLRRNQKLALEHGMYDFNESFVFKGDKLLGRKESIDGGRFLYSYLDPYRAYLEQAGFIRHLAPGPFDTESRNRRKDLFGTIVFVSDLDVDLEGMYSLYGTRWDIELCFKTYKDILELSQTRVHSDYSVIGSELVNFVSSVVSARMITAFDRAGLLERQTFRGLMKDFRAIRKYRVGADEEWSVYQEAKYKIQMLVDMDLLEGTKTPPKRKRGRTRKVQADAEKTEPSAAQETPEEGAEAHA